MAYRLVVGLGNPGREYDGTRHNVGFEIVDLWAKRKQLKGQPSSEWTRCRYADALETKLDDGTILLKPQTYMNLSGEAIQDTIRWFKLEVGDLLVIVDDVALPLGRLRLRGDGSHGGHNGLKSVEQSLNTQNYARLRVGVDQPRPVTESGIRPDLADHVLGKFLKEEREVLEKVKDRAIEIIEICQNEGLQTAMNSGNQNI
jgi:PTH1 family peptidyl-tRNA hydrolase